MWPNWLEFDVGDDTWHAYADRLTPEQMEVMTRCDLFLHHPGGPEAHRLGMIAMAQTYIDPDWGVPWHRRPFRR